MLYEGPPGIVHGGFLALLFDCVLQQLNCDLGVAGKTDDPERPLSAPDAASHETPHRRGTRDRRQQDPVERDSCYRDDELLCSAEMTAVAGNRDSLPVRLTEETDRHDGRGIYRSRSAR